MTRALVAAVVLLVSVGTVGAGGKRNARPPANRGLADLHDADIRKPGGKEYERKFITDFQNRFDEVLLGTCAPRQGLPASFEMYVVIADGGSVSEVVLQPETEAGVCLRKALVGAAFEKPPFAPFHIRIRETFEH